MMIEHATVIGYQDGIAEVQCLAKSSCGSCAAQASCGSKALSALAGEKHAPRFKLAVNEILQVGEIIKLGLPEQSLLKSVGLLYGLPLFTLLFSTILLSQCLQNELWIALGGVIFTLVCFFAIHQFVKKQHTHLTPIYLGRA